MTIDEGKTGTNLAVIYGGRTPEHYVSVRGARALIGAASQAGYNVVPILISPAGDWYLQSLEGDVPVFVRPEPGGVLYCTRTYKPLQNIDVGFPAIHGYSGDDGTIASLFRLMEVPYVGSSVLTSAIASSKTRSRQMLAFFDILQPRFVSISEKEWQADIEECRHTILNNVGLPCFVKPDGGGSSIGVERVTNAEFINSAVESALRYDRRVIVEQALTVGKELSVSVMGGRTPLVSEIGQVVYQTSFLSYTAKYHDVRTHVKIPADIHPSISNQIKTAALKIYQSIDFHGLNRFDFIQTEEDELYLLELDAIPGLGQGSMAPALWEATGVSYIKLLNNLVTGAIKRRQAEAVLVREPPTLLSI